MPTNNAQRGMALVIVLWSMAALGMVAASLMLVSRNELDYQHIFQERAQARAMADGAINQVALWVSANATMSTAVHGYDIAFDDKTVRVTARPASGFIDVGDADLPLLTQLFQQAGQQGPAQAEQLAERVNQKREQGALRSIEDLRQITEITPTLFDKIAPVITVGMGSDRVNIRAATPEVLSVLAGGEQHVVQQILNERFQPDIDHDHLVRELNRSYLTQAGASVYRFDARVTTDSGSQLSRVMWFDMSESSPDQQRPWRPMRIEPIIAVEQ